MHAETEQGPLGSLATGVTGLLSRGQAEAISLTLEVKSATSLATIIWDTSLERLQSKLER